MASKSDFQPTAIQFTPTEHHKPYNFISPSKLNLKGRSVFVTGASKGIGKATVLAFAAAGASNIAAGARSDLFPLIDEIKATAKQHGRDEPTALTLNLDVTSEESVEDAVKLIKDKFNGHLDILINNAGYLEQFVPIIESDPLEWWKTWDVNVRGTYLVTRACLPLLLTSSTSPSAGRDGLKTILNISSIGALRSRPGASGYQTTKLAVLRFSEFVNAEYGEQGVVCFAAHPGGVMTELASNMPEELHGILGDEPELAGETFVWLTGGGKGKGEREWLRGRYVSVNWDMEEFIGMREKVVRGDLLKVRVVV